MSDETIVVKTINLIRTLVLVVISISVIYHTVLHIDSREDSCRWLLQHGKLVADQKWQPTGCLLYSYNKTDSKLCLRRAASGPSGSRVHLVLMGDTRLLQLYNHLVEHMFAKSDYTPMAHNYSLFDQSAQHDSLYEDPELNLKVEFRWRPVPNPQLYDDFRELLLTDWSQQSTAATAGVHNISTPVNTNRIIIVGQSLWPVNKHDRMDLMMDNYKTELSRLLTFLEPLMHKPVTTAPKSTTKVLWSLQDPVLEKKSQRLVNISNSDIDEINYITKSLVRTMSINGLSLLTSHFAIARSLVDYLEEDGIHSSNLIVEHKSQVILNYICNRVYNFDSTCCSTPHKITFMQMLFISSALVIITIYLAYLIWPYLMFNRKSLKTIKWQKVPQFDNTTSDTNTQTQEEEEAAAAAAENQDFVTLFVNRQTAARELIPKIKEGLLINVANLTIAILFMFICDRTNFFMKENKYFTFANFILPLVYMFALGTFFTEARPDSSHTWAGCMLNRNQTDEWKGWMQLVVLIYNLSSAESNLRIYMLIRVLLSSYLFLTGFGHFTYFYKTGDTSFQRLCYITLRLNLLVICLCLCMNRPYQYYYFVPLVTFWFMVVFLFMKIKPIKNPYKPTANDHFWIIFKLLMLVGLTTLLYLSEVFFEKVFMLGPWSFLFTSGRDYTTIKEWWHHWSVDRYSVSAGMIYGLVHWTIVAPYMGISDETITRGSACHSRESSQGSQDGLVLTNPLVTLQDVIKFRSRYIITIALVGVTFYSLFAATCTDKASCDEIHAYISFVPIICYIILRNGNEFLRNRHSTLFAFIGRISLGLSICQYHIWLAAGQKGLLVIIPSNPTLNLVMTSIIFVTTARKLVSINKQLSLYATGELQQAS